MTRRLVVCFVLGAALGTLLDGIHAYGDVLSYPNPAFGRWAWFVPVEFGLVGAGAGLAIPRLERLVGLARGWSLERRVAELLLFAALYFSTTLVEGAGAAVLALALGALALARLVRHEAPGDWAYALIAALAGPTAEAVMSALGIFDYEHPDFAGIPIWLPSLWANGGLLIRRLLQPLVVTRGRETTADRS